MAEGYIQVPTDGSGKKVDVNAVFVPAGTVITNSDGTTTTLSVDAIYYRQVTAIGDGSAFGLVASVRGEAGKASLEISSDALRVLERIDQHLEEIHDLLELTVSK
jgi:hypothetical protein